MNNYYYRGYQPYRDSRFIGFGLWPFVAGLGLGSLLVTPFLFNRPYPCPYPGCPYPYPPFPAAYPPPSPYPSFPPGYPMRIK